MRGDEGRGELLERAAGVHSGATVSRIDKEGPVANAVELVSMCQVEIVRTRLRWWH